mgnify:CR=1 FL=1
MTEKISRLTVGEAMNLWDSKVRVCAVRATATEQMRQLFQAVANTGFEDGRDFEWWARPDNPNSDPIRGR